MKLTTKTKSTLYFHAYHAMRSSLEGNEAQYQLHCRRVATILDGLLPIPRATAKLVCIHAFEQAEKDHKAKR